MLTCLGTCSHRRLPKKPVLTKVSVGFFLGARIIRSAYQTHGYKHRVQLPTPCRLAPGLGFMGLDRQPLHVLRRVRPGAFQRHDVVDLPTRAGQTVPPGSWASLLPDKLMAGLLVALDAGINLTCDAQCK